MGFKFSIALPLNPLKVVTHYSDPWFKIAWQAHYETKPALFIESLSGSPMSAN